MERLNRDLLIAVLAVQADTALHPALLSAVRNWLEDPRQSLTRVIKGAGLLDNVQILELEHLAEAHLKKNQDVLGPSLDTLVARADAEYLDRDSRSWPADDARHDPGGRARPARHGNIPDGLGTGGHVARSDGGCAGRRPRAVPAAPSARAGRNRSGVGRPRLRAERNVRAKEIQPRYAERSDQRSRFILEAEITGNLEHPGIVPVYSLGRTAEGRPYYAMRFIRGESLSVAIRRFHDGLGEESKGQAKRAQTDLGNRVSAVARPVSRHLRCDRLRTQPRVLHRDLKPANIMLGRYGETLVVDWGLAKVIGTNDVVRDADLEVERHLSDGSITSSGETVEGTTIGTPAYMSPEQARGSIDKLSHASDVYSLGATLYELLTGASPFRASPCPK